MFCDGCGASLPAGSAFCSRCGKALTGPVALATTLPKQGRVQKHIHLLGILWLAVSALHALAGLAMVIVANVIFINGGPAEVPTFVHPLITIIGYLILAKSALGFLTGWGLMQREPWARILALVLGFLSLFNPPFGTALGIYTLWVLLPQPSHQEYEQLSQERAA